MKKEKLTEAQAAKIHAEVKKHSEIVRNWMQGSTNITTEEAMDSLHCLSVLCWKGLIY